jgi:hypothetical protein
MMPGWIADASGRERRTIWRPAMRWIFGMQDYMAMDDNVVLDRLRREELWLINHSSA